MPTYPTVAAADRRPLGRSMKRHVIVTSLLGATLVGALGGILFERYVGADQVVDRAGLRHVVMAYRTGEPGDRAPVPVSSLIKGRTMVALVFGQSNAANSGESLGHEHPGVYEYYRGRIYNAKDPLLGAAGNRGSVWLRFGALAIRSGAFDNVILVPFATGTAEISSWAPGGSLHRRLLAVMADARAAGLEFTHLLWHQGEADAIAGNSGDAYQHAFRAMVASIRQQGVAAPIYIARATRCGRMRLAEGIRQAQGAVVDSAAGILPGPDTDTLGFGERYDGCHFSTEGLERAAELWLQSIRNPVDSTVKR